MRLLPGGAHRATTARRTRGTPATSDPGCRDARSCTSNLASSVPPRHNVKGRIFCTTGPSYRAFAPRSNSRTGRTACGRRSADGGLVRVAPARVAQFALTWRATPSTLGIVWGIRMLFVEGDMTIRWRPRGRGWIPFKAQPRRRRVFRPRLELLEDRLAPATF